MSLADLVQAKKTQRDKDWPMIARLLEANYAERKEAPSTEQMRFWLHEMRTAPYLVDIARQYPSAAAEIAVERALLQHAIAGEAEALETAWRKSRPRTKTRQEILAAVLAEIEQLRHVAIQ